MRRLASLLILFVCIGSGFWFAHWNRDAVRTDIQLPEIRLESVHPLVARHIESQIEQLRTNADRAPLWGNLGMTLHSHGFTEQGVTCLKKAAELDPSDFRWPYFLGVIHEATDYTKTLSNYRIAIRLRPDYLPLRIRLAQTLMRVGELDECSELLEASPASERNNPYLLVTQARFELLRGKLQDAKTRLLEATEQSGWSPRPAYVELVKIATREQEQELAETYQNKLEELPVVSKMEFPDPVLTDASRNNALAKELAQNADFALARGNLDEAIGLFEEFRKIRPDMPSSWVNLAQAHSRAGDYPQSQKLYLEALERFPNHLPAIVGLAYAQSSMGRITEAIELYEKALVIKRDQKEVWFSLGLLFEQLDNLDEAIESYRRAIEIDPNYPQPHLTLGALLIEKKQLDEARQLISRAAELVPNDPVPLSYLERLDTLDREKSANE